MQPTLPCHKSRLAAFGASPLPGTPGTKRLEPARRVVVDAGDRRRRGCITAASVTVPSPERADEGRAAAPAPGRDPRRLAEILEEIQKVGPLSVEELVASLRERAEVRIAFSGRPERDRRSDVEGRLRELAGLSWIEENVQKWALTETGKVIPPWGPVSDPARFARALCLAHERHNKHVISRLLSRLWELHPTRQGAVVLARPPMTALPVDQAALRRWIPDILTSWLGRLAREMTGFVLPSSLDEAAQTVERTLGEGWEGLVPSERKRRLEKAMVDRLHELLFGGIVAPRDLSVWQSRMDWAGLALVARKLPGVRGQVWFPVGAFRRSGNPSFTPVDGLAHDGLVYHVHTPSGLEAEAQFAASLYHCYRVRQQRDKTEYVSLLAVRDHVCYTLRVGNSRFESLLQQIFPRVLRGDLPYAIALEVDLSPTDRRNIAGALPVIIDGTPRYILSMRQRTKSEGPAT